MKVATNEKRKYKGELLTINQWKKKGYKPKENEVPERMWSNQQSCGSGNAARYSFDYYYDYQVEKIDNQSSKQQWLEAITRHCD